MLLNSAENDLINVKDEDKVRLYIAISSNRGWASGFGRSFGGMMLYLGLHQLSGRLEGLHLNVTSQAYLVTSRQDHLDEALAGDYTHLLYLDDDQTFPHDLVDRLLPHDKSLMSCNYRKKGDKVDFTCTDMNNQHIDSRGKTGIERIFSSGLGVTLIKLDAIRHIPRPHFGVMMHPENGKFIIEDCFFANILYHHGIEMFVDHDLSQEIGHIGEVEWRISEASNEVSIGHNPDLIKKEV